MTSPHHNLQAFERSREYKTAIKAIAAVGRKYGRASALTTVARMAAMSLIGPDAGMRDFHAAAAEVLRHLRPMLDGAGLSTIEHTPGAGN